MAYDSFGSGLARSPLQRVLLSKLGDSGVPTVQEQQAQKMAANNLWLEAEKAGIIVEDPNDADLGWKIDIAALNNPINKIVTDKLGKQIPGFLKYTRKSRRSLRKYPEKYAKGKLVGIQDVGNGESVIQNGSPETGVGEKGVEGEESFIRFPNKDIEGLGKVMLRNLWVKGKGEMHYYNKATKLAEGMGVDLDELMTLTGAEYEAENAEVERLQGELARVQKSIDNYAADDEDLEPEEIRSAVGELLVEEEDIKEQLQNSVETLVTASGIDIQTDPISQAKKLEEDRKVRGGDIAEKIMEGVRPPEEVVTDPDAVLEQRAALSRNGDPTHFSENWSTKLSPQSLREQSNRHTDIIKRTEAFPLYGGPIMGSRGSARRVKRASLNIAKKQAQIDTLISQGKAGSPSIQRHKDQMAKDQLYIDKEMMKYEHKKVVTAKEDIPGVGPVTTQTLVSTGDGDNDVENQPPTPAAEEDHINKRAKLDPDKNALEIELKQINAKLIAAKRNLKTPSDVIKSKKASLAEKRLVLDELAYNWSLMVGEKGIVRLNEMRSLINQVTLGLGPAELEAKNNAYKETLKHTLDMRQHFMEKFEDYNSTVRTHTYNILDVLYDKETGFKGFSPEVMNSFTSNMNSIYSIWEESIDQKQTHLLERIQIHKIV